MNYSETVAYLYTQLPMFTRVGGAAYKGSLDNTIALCNALGNPQHQFKSIHVAGTNGKGSTSHMLAAIFQTAGYKTGLYTSPHLYDFRERIKIDGVLCQESFVVDFVAQIQPLVITLQPSFFEITVAMAFAYFAANKVDIAIIEVGMGGRLDSTNVILPQLCIITNIGYDHMQFLGNTLPLIAAEKAGIIKPKTPVIISEYLPETRPVFEQVAAQNQAPIIFASDEWQMVNHQYVPPYAQWQIKKGNQLLEYHLDLLGLYQAHNLIGVLAAVTFLNQNGWHLSAQTVTTALQQVKKTTGLCGRWDVLRAHSPLIIADVGHNEAGIAQIVYQLKHTPYKRLHVVLGMVKDKAIDKVLALLPQAAVYYFTQAAIPRALPATELQEQAMPYGLKGHHYTIVQHAAQAAVDNTEQGDLILICGSFFIVAEVDLAAIQFKDVANPLPAAQSK